MTANIQPSRIKAGLMTLTGTTSNGTTNVLKLVNHTGSTIAYINSLGNVYAKNVSISGKFYSSGMTSGSTTYGVKYNPSTKELTYASDISSNARNNVYLYSAVTSNVQLVTGSSFVILANPSAPISISLPATPINGQVFRIKDVSGNALTNNITINGNGKNIDGDTCALINTNYGSFELLYNGTNWFNLSFVF